MSSDVQKARYLLVQVVFICGALALWFRCFQLQVWDTSYQQQHSYRQALTLYPSRGLIYDRNGKLLVYNRAIYNLMATYEQVRKADIDTLRFCELLGITPETFERNLQKDFSDKRFSKLKPFEFLVRVSADSFAKFEEHLYEFPGFEAVRRHVRGYNNFAAAHALGYIGEVNQDQINQYGKEYSQGDYIGVSGLESFYEIPLKGRKGTKHVLKDKWGKIQGAYKNGLLDEPAYSGLDLISSIDLDLQEYAELLMQNKRGAIVAIEPETGEILVMLSSPAYNPEEMSTSYARLAQDSLKPLFNRALMAKYPPGSVFKVVMSAIGLQEGILTEDRGMGCGGGFVFGNLRVGCHGHGPINSVAAAIQYSCNTYYCQTFRELVNQYGYENPDKGLDKLADHLKHFGLGRMIGVDVPGEIPGRVPNSHFYNKRYGKGRWRFSNCVSLGIGQGEMELTPLQMANITAIIANRGWYRIPHFAKELRGDTMNQLALYREKHYTKVYARHFDAVIQGMENVVLAGTARRAFTPGITICGKTGTVQNPHGRDHSNFVAFAPKDNPKIAIVAYVENSGFGSTYAAPIASLIIEKYLRGEILDPSRKALEKAMIEADLISPPKYSFGAAGGASPTATEASPNTEGQQE